MLTNGKVLVAGGLFGSSSLSSAELYDPANGTWAATGSLSQFTGRREHTATLLPNDQVLVAGGSNSNYVLIAELYDPASGTWTATGSLVNERDKHTATLLPSGKVLVTGGDNGAILASAELYDGAPILIPPPHGGLSATILKVNESSSPSANVADTVLRFSAQQSGAGRP